MKSFRKFLVRHRVSISSYSFAFLALGLLAIHLVYLSSLLNIENGNNFLAAVSETQLVSVPVIWTNVQNASVAGNTIVANSLCNCGVDDVRATAVPQLKGNGNLQFSIPVLHKLSGISLDGGTTTVGLKNLDFSLQFLSGGKVDVVEEGVTKTSVFYKINDRFKISVENRKIRYYKNNQLFYTSRKSPTFPLIPKVAMTEKGTSFTEVNIGTLTTVSNPTIIPPPPTATTTPTNAPGGFIEKSTATRMITLFTPTQINSFVPSTRGPFTFPAPYNTRGARITIPSDCNNTDCINSVGYSYWRNTNNHINSNEILIFLGLPYAYGGPTLFSYDKVTEAVTKKGSLFDANSAYNYASGEGWYFSATKQNTLYVWLSVDSKLSQYDVSNKNLTTVLDISGQAGIYGSNRSIWQPHSSNNDNVHSFTVSDKTTYASLGCGAYRVSDNKYFFFPTKGFSFDECQIDKSGRYLVMKDKLGTDPQSEFDNRIFDLQANPPVEIDLMDRDGAGGHSDNGFNTMLASDNWTSSWASIRIWDLKTSPLAPGNIVYHPLNWSQGGMPNHVSFANASDTLPIDQQYACGSGADSSGNAQANEIICFKLDGSLDTLIVAPVMTNVNAPGGGDSYEKLPKGNLDITGRYMVWTSNMGGSRQDAFIVKIPAHLISN